jgi:dihydropteroate synthase
VPWFAQRSEATTFPGMNPTMSATLPEILNSHRTHRPVVMGILNVTPDSFSDGGEFLDPAGAIAHARQMVSAGADIIDVGAESSRPGSERVPAAEQIRRLAPVLSEVARLGAVVSIDTTLGEVARFALSAGAAIINDISAGREDPGISELAAQRGCGLVLMHMLGEPKTMQQSPRYDDVVAQVRDFLADRLVAAEAQGVPRAHCIIDPGIGFGKLAEHNLTLLAHMAELAKLGAAVLAGPSRKRFIGQIAGEASAAGRLGGTIAACLAAYHGGATIFRVHDVGPVREALLVARAIGEANGVSGSQ